MRTARQQVRNNAYVYVDEGEQLFKQGERNGATIMAMLRSAWTGEVLGQAKRQRRVHPHHPRGLVLVGPRRRVAARESGPAPTAIRVLVPVVTTPLWAALAVMLVIGFVVGLLVSRGR